MALWPMARLVLGVDTVCIDWANVDALNASKADRLVSMDTYGCTCGGAADLEFTNVLLHGLRSAGKVSPTSSSYSV